MKTQTTHLSATTTSKLTSSEEAAVSNPSLLQPQHSLTPDNLQGQIKMDILVTISNPPDPNNTHKHWALYLNDPSNPIKTTFEVRGSTGRYRYEPEIKPQNVRLSRDLVGLVPICTVEPSKASKIKEIAGTVRVRDKRGCR